MRSLDASKPRRILVRGTNWVGDAVMTLPALDALCQSLPQARVEVLARPWAAPVYAACASRPKVRVLGGRGASSRLRQAWGLRKERFDWAVLFQNAFEAALIARLAGAPVRIGYNRDGRGLLLTHRLDCTERLRSIHETSYYLHILGGAGIIKSQPPDKGVAPELALPRADVQWADGFTAGLGAEGPLLGLAPGAAFGPAKCWPAERFAQAARELAWEGGAVLIFGSKGEHQACEDVAQSLKGLKAINLAGQTGLGQALGLLARLKVFLTNDSGLMHAAAALGTPTVAVFGSTNPVTTSPLGPWVRVLRHPVDCSPCLEKVCPRDMRCFLGVEAAEAVEAARGLLEEKER